MKHIIFVYGTLRQGFHNHRLLAGSKFLGEGSAYGVKLYDAGPFPAVLKEHKSAVLGELYEVDDTTLARLDRLESVPHLYRRETVLCDLHEESDAEIDAFIYIWNQSPDRLKAIPGGDYKEHDYAATTF
jgi:gamma-glutamylcyclotransferase (GGCT)/AIG2-like uncharacterized protein YtfP